MKIFQREQRSLFGEILDWMLTPLLLLWPVSLALTWLVAQSIAGIPEIAAAPDVVMIADRTRKPIAAVAAAYFAAEAYFRVDRVVTAARRIAVPDYFDRLALDRALDSIGDAERRLTAAMVETGESGEAAVEAWVKPRHAEVERIRAAIHQIAGSGLTLSKLTVAASLLGDLAKG